MVKMFSCGTLAKGYRTNTCSNQSCHHQETITFSCNSRFCPTCGKRATDQWIEKQKSILPQTEWQHITFTMPSQLWPIFRNHRQLLNDLAKLAAQTIIDTAKDNGLNVAVFTAMHTFGRDLKWHPHIHLSVTMGGLTEDHQQWKPIRFSKKVIMPMWRYNIIHMLREKSKSGELDLSNYFLNMQYNKDWIVHFAKPTKTPFKTISYLGRYLKKPPLSQSRLLHYDGRYVAFNYLNHKTKAYQKGQYTMIDFITRFTQHIPEKGFRLIRYYGILANRVRSQLLAIVYELLEQPSTEPKSFSWASMVIRNERRDPMVCILCQSKMIKSAFNPGYPNKKLVKMHEQFALQKIIHPFEG